jgi:hypothetical protein
MVRSRSGDVLRPRFSTWDALDYGFDDQEVFFRRLRDRRADRRSPHQ